MDVDSAAGRGGTGSARRRRERRLRQHWRHEQLTLQMLLATYQHHAAPRGQDDGQERGVGERVELHGDDPEDPHSPGGRHRVLSIGRG